MSPAEVWLQEAAFLAFACACLAWAQWRLPGSGLAPFPGPRPVGRVFRVWLIVIWLVGLALPLAALLVEGVFGGRAAAAVRLALLPYFAMFALQVASELWCWKVLRSPIWVLVPCLYLPWRLWQCARGLELVPAEAPLTSLTLWALAALWLVNIGVHYTNIPRTLRWDYHRPDARFATLRDPRVFTADAQDARVADSPSPTMTRGAN